jgi:hypothetical protein
MAHLQHRLQVLIDDERFQRLRDESARTGAPVGEIVRRAIDRELTDDQEKRALAARRLLAAARPEGREPDWEVSKAEMLESFYALPDD